MRIRCWKCGHTEFIFTTNDERFGKHHGAICANCQKPLTLKDCLFRKTSMGAFQPEDKELRMTAETVKLPQGLAEIFGSRGKR